MVVVEGRGLHTGVPARVTIAAREGETTLQGEALSKWRTTPAERSTAIACGELRARTVEHLFAAMAALGLSRGVEVWLEGPEVPLLDGGATRWMAALASLGVRRSPASRVVARAARIEVGASVYTFSPGDDVQTAVDVELDDERLARSARWDGDPDDFRLRIAPARTFCFASEVEALARAGLASHVEPESVVVLGPDILAAGRPFAPDEPAHHKLLDLVGDLFLHGGPLRGLVHAHRPGHTATHEAMRRAIDAGIVG